MSDKRLGRQTPTVSTVLPYEASLGADAAAVYNSSGRTAQPWQELMLEDIMAVNGDGLWVHMKFGWSIPRRNGKSEVLIMRALYAVSHGERVLYTAHRTTTSHNAYEKILDRLTKAGYEKDRDFISTKQFGLEHIQWMDGEGVINFRTRTNGGGLGEGYDLLVIDEAQEYTADQESTLKYVVTDSKNPQTLMCGTPPTAVSAGTVFLKYRSGCLTGSENAHDCGWAEWSVPELTDAHDPELWYETNPSLGTILTERTIRSELGDDQVDDNIQRLGLWLRYSQRSAISRREWDSLRLPEKPVLKEPVRLFFGVKFSRSTGNVSLAAAVKQSDGRIFVEALDCRPVREGSGWIIAFLRNPHAVRVCIDGAGDQSILVNDMSSAQVKCAAVLPKSSEVIEANALFEQKLFEGSICHSGQPALAQAAANCEHRAIGSSGGFGYSSILKGADASLLEAVSLAHWICASTKEASKQVFQY